MLRQFRNFFHPNRWENWIGDYAFTGEIVRPRSLQALMQEVESAVRQRRRIRAVGSGHSHSNAARPNDIFVDLSNLNRELESSWLREDINPRDLVRVEAGVTIKQLNRRILTPNPPGENNRALPNMGTFDGQTIAGAISTATHGTGIELGNLADLVRPIEMVTVTINEETGMPVVQLHRIEPRDGITDRTLFDAEDNRDVPMILEQGDDMFYSTVVSYGCMGIIYACTLQVQPEYWLRETSELVSWVDLREQLEEGRVFRPDPAGRPRHYAVLINIAEMQGNRATDDPICLVRTHDIVTGFVPPWTWRLYGPPERRTPGLGESIGTLWGRNGIDPHEENNLRGGQLRRGFFSPQARRVPFGKWFRSNTDITASYIALRRERDGTRGAPNPPPAAISAEIAVPAERVAPAIDLIIEEIRRSDLFFFVPLGLRFTAASPHYLAPQFERESAMIEIPFLIRHSKERIRTERRDTDAKPALAQIERTLREEGILRGRPHLGKHFDLEGLPLERRELRYSYRWLAFYQRFNPVGTFNNDFTEQFGISMPIN